MIVFNYVFNIGICVQFSQGQYTFDESAGYALLKVTVSGHRTSPMSVNAKVFVSSSFQPKEGMYVHKYCNCLHFCSANAKMKLQVFSYFYSKHS